MAKLQEALTTLVVAAMEHAKASLLQRKLKSLQKTNDISYKNSLIKQSVNKIVGGIKEKGSRNYDRVSMLSTILIFIFVIQPACARAWSFLWLAGWGES